MPAPLRIKLSPEEARTLRERRSVDRKVLRSLKNGNLRYSFWGEYTKANSLAQ